LALWRLSEWLGDVTTWVSGLPFQVAILLDRETVMARLLARADRIVERTSGMLAAYRREAHQPEPSE
jgi:chloramphenicol 3-O-phosphotransferase